MKKNNTNINLILSALLAILTICLFIYFLRIIKNKNEHTSAVLSVLEKKMQDKENSVIFSQKITEIKSIESSINNYFLDPNEIDIFVDYLEKIGLNFGSEVVVNNIEIPEKIKDTILFKLSIIGSFDDVMKTTTFLENIPYQINITQIYLNKNTKKITPEINKEETEILELPKWQSDIYLSILSSS